MIIALLLQAAVAASGQSSDVVVTGERLDATEKALRACVARECPPVADINATIAHADNQFIAGDFAGARRTLLASRERNKRFAAQYPVAVGELLRVDGFVAQLVGQPEYARIGTIDSVDALKKGLAPDDELIAKQRLEVAEIFMRQGRGRTAVNMLDAIAERAHEQGWSRVEAEARLRAAALYAARSTSAPELRAQARERLAQLRAMTAPEAKAYADAAVLIDARIAQLDGDEQALALARAKAQATKVDRAILVYAPTVDLGQALIVGNVSRVYDAKDQWVDVRYTVAPDGSVRDLTELNRGKDANGRWIDVAKDSVVNRQYLPLAQAADGPGMERLERFVLVSALDTRVGSRLRLPYGTPRLQSVDLSPLDAAPGTRSTVTPGAATPTRG